MSVIAADDYLSWGGRRDLFEKTVAYRRDIVTLTNAGDPDQVFVVRTSQQMFSLLGVSARLGERSRFGRCTEWREFCGDRDRLWRRKIDSDPRILGRTIQVSGEAFTIVGGMSPGVN